MRILQIAPPWFPVQPTGYGGVEHIVASLADGLADAGHNVTLLASGGSRTRARLRTVYDTAPSELLSDPFTELGHVLEGYRGRADFDLIHDHTGLGPALAAVSDGPPVVHTLHGRWTPASARMYRRVADRVHLVAVSRDQASRVPACLRLAGVVHNGISFAAYPAGRHDGGYLAFVGRASPEKGPAVAIDVARRLDLPLRMAIKVNEPDECRYWAEVIAPRLAGGDVQVIREASHADKIALLGGAQVVLFPIAWPEPFGLVMVEANACGAPVVAFAEGAAPEVIADGTTGVLVAPGDVEGFCAAVVRAAGLDPAACRRHVQGRFTDQAMVRGYLEVYARAIGSGGAPTDAPSRPPRHPEPEPQDWWPQPRLMATGSG